MCLFIALCFYLPGPAVADAGRHDACWPFTVLATPLPPIPPALKHIAFEVEVVAYYYSCIDTNIHSAQHSTLMWTDTSDWSVAVCTAFDACRLCTCKNKTLIVQYKQEITYRPCLILFLAQLQ